MKNLLLSMLAISIIALSSCSDDDNGTDNPLDKFTVENFKGDVTESMTLDASKVYKLSGKLLVKSGATLTIPAGTRIEATTPTSANSEVRYIAVEQGAKINIDGTANSPVVMTSDVKEAEAWGGLVLCGYAPTNKADANAGAEVSGLTYGGDVADDNSGSITYLRLEYTGYKYTDTKEFNGLSLFGVGSGTTLDYIVSYKGGDDGMEFFGGTVNASHFVSVDSEDDGIDFADGWSGTGEYWVSINSTKSGIEGSNNGDNGAATPMTNATLKNLTVYGMGEKPFYLKEGAGKMNINNIVIGGLADGKAQAYFYADDASKDAAAHARIDAGDIKVTDVKFVNMGEGNTVKTVAGLTVSENFSASGAGNGINKPDWMPDALNTINATTTVFGDAVKSTLVLNEDITSDKTLDANTTYILDGPVIVKKGAKLTIPAGTVIIASEVTQANAAVRYIAVEQGAQIFVNGTADAPVVMTCAKEEAEAWGGLVLCGYAPTNKADASAGAEVSGLTYGGDVADDNSGSITYLRLEYTGYKYTDTKEFNGLSLFAVGSATVLDYIVSYKGGDDGMEFFGGTVNATHFVSVDSEDDGIDFADGWNGTGEYWLSINSTKSGIEGSNNGDNGTATPMTNATLKNLTVYGMGEKPFYLKEGAGKMNIDNIVIGGLAANKAQAYFYADDATKDATAHARIDAGDIVVTNVKFVDMGTGNDVKAITGLTVTENADATGAGAGTAKPTWLSDALNKAYNGTTIVQ
ncbi:hypothetical protein [Labilibaculum euxinus]